MEMPVEKKENKTWAVVGTVAAIALCGLPGLCVLCPISIAAFSGAFNNPDWGNITPGYGGITLCLSVVFIAIAVLVPVLTLRKKKPAAPAVEVLPPQEPLPPAS